MPNPSNFNDLAGRTFSRLTVVRRGANTPSGQSRWECLCQCGNSRVVAGYHLTSGHTQSCGCAKVGARATHRMKGTPTHNTWCAMKQRCNYPASDEYAAYGGRGVKVCDRWNDSFEDFLADMGPRPAGKTIDRYPNRDGNYEPGNCRWATGDEQARNRSTTIFVERDGRRQCIKDWCVELGLNMDRVYGRIRRGATPQEALKC